MECRIGTLEACHAHRDAELDRRMHATVQWAIKIISSMPGGSSARADPARLVGSLGSVQRVVTHRFKNHSTEAFT